MNLVLTVLEIAAPVFALAAIGWAWVRLDEPYPVEFVTKLAMTIAVPCLIFTALAGTETSAAALTQIALAALATYVAIGVVGWGLVVLLRLDIRTYLAPFIMGNTGNVGLPLALLAFGQTGLEFAIIVFAFTAIGQFTLGVWLVAKDMTPFALLREPMVIATILGALFLITGWETPRVVTTTLELVAQLAIPLMLITLGVAVGRLGPSGLGRATWFSVLKVGTCAGLAAMVGTALGLPPVAFAVLVVQFGTPIAVTNYLIAEKYGADAQAVAGLVVMSTLLSIGTLPLLLALVL
ncbi:MAG: AEC family transporter [Shimia sp.]